MSGERSNFQWAEDLKGKTGVERITKNKKNPKGEKKKELKPPVNLKQREGKEKKINVGPDW